MAARRKEGLDMPICMTILITQAIKTNRNRNLTLNTTFLLYWFFPSSLYVERGFVNPPKPVLYIQKRENTVLQIRYTKSTNHNLH